MEYAYATCILNESGEEINEENLTAVLEAAGCTVQTSRVKAIVAALEDLDVGAISDVSLDDVGLDDDPRETRRGEEREPTADGVSTAERETTDAPGDLDDGVDPAPAGDDVSALEDPARTGPAEEG